MSDLPTNAQPGGEDDVDLGEFELDDPDNLGEDLDPPDDPDEIGQPADDPDADPDPDPEADRPRRKTQAQRWRERAERTERELAEMRGQVSVLTQRPAQQQPAYDPQAAARAESEENERLAMMTPAEVARYFYQKGQREISGALLQQNINTQEQIDKRDYAAEARNSKVHRDYNARVEELVTQHRARGMFISREDALAHLVGKDALTRATRAAPAQRRQAQQRVNGQRTRPVNGRGDTAPRGRSNQADADAALLRNVRAGDL